MVSDAQSAHSTALRRQCLPLVACWALPGVIYCTGEFAPWIVPASLPGWLSWIVAVAALIVLPVSAVFLLPLLLAGLVHVRGAAPAGWRWPIAWLVAIAAGVTLEVLVVRVMQPFPSPSAADWLLLSIGFLGIGTAMIAVLIGAARSGPHQPGGPTQSDGHSPVPL